MKRGYGITIGRNIIRWISPSLYRWISYYRNDVTVDRLGRKLYALSGGKVMSGPFMGMRYVEKAAGSALAPKLIGCYEEELHPVWERIFQEKYERIVDIGAAEGYYAVGLAYRFPETRVIAFESDENARAMCGEMGRMNGVGERLEIYGTCSVSTLKDTLIPGCLVICDCEGYESVLLDPAAVPMLRECDILVETHDYLVPGVKELLEGRFKNGHQIQWVGSCPRDSARYPQLRGLNSRQKRLAVYEFRPAHQKWAWITCRGKRRGMNDN